MHDLLTSLDMGEEHLADRDEDEAQDADEKSRDEAGEKGGAEREDAKQGVTEEEAKLAADDTSELSTETDGSPTAERPDDLDVGDSREAAEPLRSRHAGANEPRPPLSAGRATV